MEKGKAVESVEPEKKEREKNIPCYPSNKERKY